MTTASTLVSPALSSWQMTPSDLFSCFGRGLSHTLLDCRPPLPPTDDRSDSPSHSYNLSIAEAPVSVPGVCGNSSTTMDADPTFDPMDAVLAAHYPRGTVAGPGSGQLGRTGPQRGLMSIGGVSTYLLPFEDKTFPRAVLSYSVYFPADFDFVKGGKLPGLYGHLGPKGNTKECRGGVQGTKCWSVRVMWRAEGAMEVYAYLPSLGRACDTVSCIKSVGTFGFSLGRGLATFRRGCWTKLDLLVQVNQRGGDPTGLAELYVDGVSAIRADGLVFRKMGVPDGELYVRDFFFSTFFGGDTQDFAAVKDEVVYFKDFAVVGGSPESVRGLNAARRSGAMQVTRLSYLAVLCSLFIHFLFSF